MWSLSCVVRVEVWRAAGTVFFFNDTATTEIYTLSLHDALPIWSGFLLPLQIGPARGCEKVTIGKHQSSAFVRLWKNLQHRPPALGQGLPCLIMGLKPRFVFFCPWLRGGNSNRLHSLNILRFVIQKEHSRGFRRMGSVWSALGRFCYPSPSAKRHLSITRTDPFIFFPPFTLLKGGRGGDCGRKVNTNQ